MQSKTNLIILVLCGLFISKVTLTDPNLTITKELIAKFLPNNPIIVEAGAHNGADSIAMASFWPKALIYAFEPVPDLYNQLKQRTAGYKNIICSQKALSDKVGYAKMYLSEGTNGQKGYDGSSSLLKPGTLMQEIYPVLSFNHTIEVETITLDQWAEQNGIDHIDFLWLDMQGMEPIMLKSAIKILSTVKVIYTEISHVEIYEGLTVYSEYQKWLESKGFVAIKYDNYALHNKDGNVLFVRKDLAK